MFIQTQDGKVVGVYRFMPEPAEGEWEEVSEDDPRCIIAPPVAPSLAQQILSDPAQLAELKSALGLP